MQQSYALSRHTTEGFARRVRKNLEFIIKMRAEGEDVHEVTQLVISLLGLVIFPWEAHALNQIQDSSLKSLESQGWPHWDVTLDVNNGANTLGGLVHRLRNSAAHRRMRFSSDDPDPLRVQIEFEDGPANKPPTFRAAITAASLKDFCDRFTHSLEDLVG